MYFYFGTSMGPVKIVERAGKWHLVFEGAELRVYTSAHKAAQEIGDGHILTSPTGRDLTSLLIPADLDRWSYAPL